MYVLDYVNEYMDMVKIQLDFNEWIQTHQNNLLSGYIEWGNSKDRN